MTHTVNARQSRQPFLPTTLMRILVGLAVITSIGVVAAPAADDSAPREWASMKIPFELNSLTFSANGEAILITSPNLHDMKVFDVVRKAERLSLGFEQHIRDAVRLSPDGQTLVVREGNPRESRLIVIDVGSGKSRKSEAEGEPLAFSPDGKSVLLGSIGYPGQAPKTVLSLLNLATLDVTAKLEAYGVSDAIWSPNGKLVAAVLQSGPLQSIAIDNYGRRSRLKIVLLDATTLKIKAMVGKERAMDAGGRLSFSPDGKHLLVSALRSQSDERVVELWNVSETWTLEEKSPRLLKGGAAFVHGNELVAVSTGRDVILHRIDNGRAIGKVSLRSGGIDGAVSEMAFDPGPGIRYGATGNENGEIALWDLTKGKLKAVLSAHPVGIRKLACSKGGEFLASVGQDNTMKIWKLGNPARRD